MLCHRCIRCYDNEIINCCSFSFPLYCKGRERLQYNYAVYLLNKDIAQVLINSHTRICFGIQYLIIKITFYYIKEQNILQYIQLTYSNIKVNSYIASDSIQSQTVYILVHHSIQSQTVYILVHHSIQSQSSLYISSSHYPVLNSLHISSTQYPVSKLFTH